jgi:tetraacyldisaccharide 4'-kinase
LSKISYGSIEALFPSLAVRLCSLETSEEVLLITGIANPKPFIEKIKSLTTNIQIFTFPDHHYFTSLEIENMDAAFQKMSPKNKRIITTEKDAIRLKANEFLPMKWKPYLYFLPITAEFLFEQGENFDSRIKKHVKSSINIK